MRSTCLSVRITLPCSTEEHDAEIRRDARIEHPSN
jgi:hypothetical protein